MKKCLNVGCDSFSSQAENNCLVRGDISGCPDNLELAQEFQDLHTELWYNKNKNWSKINTWRVDAIYRYKLPPLADIDSVDLLDQSDPFNPAGDWVHLEVQLYFFEKYLEWTAHADKRCFEVVDTVSVAGKLFNLIRKQS